jgi:Cu/Zn superoxide dismutase
MGKGKPTKAGTSRGGKSRDANGKQHTVLREKEPHLAALDRLRRQDEGQDRSDLLNRL